MPSRERALCPFEKFAVAPFSVKKLWHPGLEVQMPFQGQEKYAILVVTKKLRG